MLLFFCSFSFQIASSPLNSTIGNLALTVPLSADSHLFVGVLNQNPQVIAGYSLHAHAVKIKSLEFNLQNQLSTSAAGLYVSSFSFPFAFKPVGITAILKDDKGVYEPSLYSNVILTMAFHSGVPKLPVDLENSPSVILNNTDASQIFSLPDNFVVGKKYYVTVTAVSANDNFFNTVDVPFQLRINVPGPELDPDQIGSGGTPGGNTLEVWGSNFGSESKTTVTVGGRPCPLTAFSTIGLKCTAPPGQGRNHRVVVTSFNLDSSQVMLYSYDPPKILVVNPNTVSVL